MFQSLSASSGKFVSICHRALATVWKKFNRLSLVLATLYKSPERVFATFAKYKCFSVANILVPVIIPHVRKLARQYWITSEDFLKSFSPLTNKGATF
jgi:hypothetical protein